MKRLSTLLKLRKPDEMENEVQYKVERAIVWTIEIAVVLYFIYETYMYFTTGENPSTLVGVLVGAYLWLTIPAEIYEIVLNRNMAKGDDEELKRHDKMVWKGALIGLAITAILIIVAVLYFASKINTV